MCSLEAILWAVERRCWLKLSKHLPGGNFTDDISFFFLLQSVLRYLIHSILFTQSKFSRNRWIESHLLAVLNIWYPACFVQVWMITCWNRFASFCDLYKQSIWSQGEDLHKHTWALSRRKLEMCTSISWNLIKTLFLQRVNSDPTALVLNFSFTALI